MTRACRPHGELPLPPHLMNLGGVGTSLLPSPNSREALPCGRPPPSLPPFSLSLPGCHHKRGLDKTLFSFSFLSSLLSNQTPFITNHLFSSQATIQRTTHISIHIILFRLLLLPFSRHRLTTHISIHIILFRLLLLPLLSPSIPPAGAFPYNPSQSHPPIFFIAGT